MIDRPDRRLARLNEQFRREISAILLRSVRDPRVQDVVVNSVEVTSDLWLARVYVRLGGEDLERREALQGLEAAGNFVRRELAAVLHIRRIPELRFLEDETLVKANRIEEILKGLEASRREEDDGDVDPMDSGDVDPMDSGDGDSRDSGDGDPADSAAGDPSDSVAGDSGDPMDGGTGDG